MSRWFDQIQSSLSTSSHFVTEIENNSKISYSDLLLRSEKWKFYLNKIDQKFILILLPNSILYLEVYLGVLGSRNIFSPVPYFVSIGELKKIIEFVSPYMIITDRDDIFYEFKNNFNIVKPSDFDQFSEKLVIHQKDIGENDIACLYYSSGTTASPKGILYSHKNIFSLISSIHRGFKFDENTRQFAFLPFGHTASINYNIHPALYAGSPLFISKGFESLRSNFFEVLSTHKINYTETVPSILMMLIKLQHSLSGLDLSSLKFIGCGSAPLAIETQKRFFEMYQIKVANLYGLSETGPSHIDDPTQAGWEAGSIGLPLDVNECRIAEDGEILLKGPNIFVNYFRNEALYKAVVINGWFHTGDLGSFKNGKFYLTDRKKDLIIKSGINIVPAEIEEVIYKSPRVLECVVVGKKDATHGEIVVAVVVPKNLDDDSEDFLLEIKTICKAHLSNYKIPSLIKVVEFIPKTHSGKLLRKEVREQLAS